MNVGGGSSLCRTIATRSSRPVARTMRSTVSDSDGACVACSAAPTESVDGSSSLVASARPLGRSRSPAEPRSRLEPFSELGGFLPCLLSGALQRAGEILLGQVLLPGVEGEHRTVPVATGRSRQSLRQSSSRSRREAPARAAGRRLLLPSACGVGRPPRTAPGPSTRSRALATRSASCAARALE